MSHLHSVKVPAVVIFTSLMVIILVSSSRNTYKLSPAAPARPGYALASCDERPVSLPVREAEPRRTCIRPGAWSGAWPRRAPPEWASAAAHDEP